MVASYVQAHLFLAIYSTEKLGMDLRNETTCVVCGCIRLLGIGGWMISLL